MAKNNKGINFPECVEKVMEQLKASNVISNYTVRGGGHTKLGSKKRPTLKYKGNRQGNQHVLDVHCGSDIGKHTAYVVPTDPSSLEASIAEYRT